MYTLVALNPHEQVPTSTALQRMSMRRVLFEANEGQLAPDLMVGRMGRTGTEEADGDEELADREAGLLLGERHLSWRGSLACRRTGGAEREREKSAPR